MKKVLIITYYWPPASGPGVQRWVKFSKYLREFGWDPVILTVSNGSYPSMDESLINDLPEDLAVHKTKTIEPFELYQKLKGNNKSKPLPVGYAGGDEKGWLNKITQKIRANWFIPDARIGWLPFAYTRAAKIIHEQNIDTVITTGPPHSTHLIGRKLKRQGTVNWVADFRDPWTNIYYNKLLPKSDRSLKKDFRLESSVIKECDQLIAVTPGMVKEFKDRKNNINLIYNGYDQEDFENVAQQSDLKFSLSYIGNYKANQNCPILWEALSELTQENADFRTDFELRIIGNLHPSVKESIEEHPITNNLVIETFVPHQTAVHKMINSQLLFFIVPNFPENELLLTGKIFEYLASKTPTFSIGPIRGNASAILKKCNRSAMVDYTDKEQMKKGILEQYLLWSTNGKSLPKHKGDEHFSYSRKGLTEQLSKVLNRI
jgi:glycosyltransferase involved in cell wall biosynthesis